LISRNVEEGADTRNEIGIAIVVVEGCDGHLEIGSDEEGVHFVDLDDTSVIAVDNVLNSSVLEVEVICSTNGGLSKEIYIFVSVKGFDYIACCFINDL